MIRTFGRVDNGEIKTVYAVQWTGDNIEEIAEFMDDYLIAIEDKLILGDRQCPIGDFIYSFSDGKDFYVDSEGSFLHRYVEAVR